MQVCNGVWLGTPDSDWLHYYGVPFPESIGLKWVLFISEQTSLLLVILDKSYSNGHLITLEPDYYSDLGGGGGEGFYKRHKSKQTYIFWGGEVEVSKPHNEM